MGRAQKKDKDNIASKQQQQLLVECNYVVKLENVLDVSWPPESETRSTRMTRGDDDDDGGGEWYVHTIERLHRYVPYHS